MPRGLVLHCAVGIAPRRRPAADIRDSSSAIGQPRSMLVTKHDGLAKPHFPAIDMHNHLGGGKEQLTPDAWQPT